MRVVRENLDGTDIQRLVVTDPRGTDHHVDEVAGYLCPECMQADETLGQIWHMDDCSHAGEHGRRHYNEDEIVSTTSSGPTPEFSDRHPITIVEFAETEGRGGLHEGEVIAFCCDECGNADEDVFEIIHDETCGLSNCG